MKANWKTILSRCVLFVITAVTAIPLLWLVVLSFKSDTDILNNPFSLPEHIDLANYERALDTLPLFKMFGNTLIVAVFALLISLVCTFMISLSLIHIYIEIPVLVINSEADTLTPQFMGQEIYDSIQNEEIKMIWTVTDSEHTEMWLDYNQEYREKVQELLNFTK